MLVEGETIDPDKLECESVEELTAAFDADTAPAIESDAVDAIHALLEEMAGNDGPYETGLAAVPAARQVQQVLRNHDAQRVPANLPSELYLTVAVADAVYAEALALERLFADDSNEQMLALWLLGDLATEASTPLLRLRLRSALDGNDPRSVSMCLRALLTADPATARREAALLLDSTDHLLPALGVFALTEPTLREELESIDLDADDVAQQLQAAGQRVAEHLATLGD